MANESVHVGSLRCFCLCVICVQVCGSLTWVSSNHFAVMSQSLETSRVQPCDADGNGLACNYEVESQGV